jgi:putative ABC transport system permease protein
MRINRWFYTLPLRLRSLFRRTQVEHELDEELRYHIERQIEENIAKGMTPEEARYAALRAMGGVERRKEECRDTRRVRLIENLAQDLRYAIRTLFRNPVFSVVALLTLAIGIGSTTAIFSVVHALLLKPLPYPDSDRLVRLIVIQTPGPPGQSSTGGPQRVPGGASVRELAELRSRMRSVSTIGVYNVARMTMIGEGEASRLEGMVISASIWHALGAKPLLGRVFDATEDAPGADPVIVLSNRAWKRFFQGDQGVIGRNIVLGDNPYTVIGVMPEEFTFANLQSEFWIPIARSPSAAGAFLARLSDGVSLQTASAEVNTILHDLRPQARAATFELSREQDEIVGPVRRPVLILMAAVAFVLLIACANVANLLLARGVARQREVAIRIALGAGRGRLMQQYLAEGVVLSLAGGAGGVALAYGGVRLLRSLATTLYRTDLGNRLPFPRIDEVGIDADVLVFALCLSMGVGLLFGLAPVFSRLAGNQPHALKGGVGIDRANSGSRWGFGSRSALLIAEVALAMTLLVGGGLLIRSFLKLSSVDAGYDPANVLTFQLALPGGRYPVPQLRELAENLVAILEKAPGVEAAAYSVQLPMVGLRDRALFRTTPAITEQPAPGAPDEDMRLVSRDYLKAMGIRIKEGRAFNEQDRADQPRVLLINESLARREFPGRSPIGETAYLRRDATPWRIIGVVQDVRQFAFDRTAEPQVFADFRQWPGVNPIGDAPQYFAVRSKGDPLSFVPAVRNAVHAIDPKVGLYNIATMEQIVAHSISRPRLYAALLGIFAAVSVTLAGIGIYGLTAYSVAQRTREIGIRMALGSSPSQARNLVIRQSMWLVAAGIIIGAAGAAAMTRFLEGLLFGVEPFDGVTLLSVVALFLFVAAVASFAPARRAARVDPMVALRAE